MWSRIQKFVEQSTAHIALWQFLGSTTVLGLLAAWGAYMTTALAPYAPLSWIVAGLVALTLSAVCYLAYGSARYWLTNARIRQSFYREGERFNPLDDLFRNKRIAIADLVSPFDSVVRNKTFMDCEIIGPANIFLMETQPGGMTLKQNLFPMSDTVMLRDDAMPQNVVGFVDCHFTKCKFYKATLLFQESAFYYANGSIQNLNWVTITPDHPSNNELFELDDMADAAAVATDVAAVAADVTHRPHVARSNNA